MSDRVDPITEEKESEVKAQDLQEDAAEKEETQEDPRPQKKKPTLQGRLADTEKGAR